MRIKEVRVRNFRSLKNICVSCDKLTVIIGPNNAGKSSFLKALEIFFNTSAEYQLEDFYNNNTNEPIEITVTFTDLDQEQREEFRDLIEDNKLVITKRCEYSVQKSKSNQKYYKRNGEKIDDSRIKKLLKDKFLLIPAVREASEDATESKKGTVLYELMKLTVKEVLSNNDEFKEKEKQIKKELEEILKTPEFESLKQKLSDNLSKYTPKISVQLNWDIRDILSIANARINLVEDNKEHSVEYVGHGLQRALIMSMLQSLNEIKISSQSQTKNNLIFAIEEPELYQHPSSQRHISKVLQKLVEDAKSNFDVQIIYVTHSPLFVDIDRFEQIRRFYKDDNTKETKAACTTLDAVNKELDEQSTQSVDRLRSKLYTTMTPWMNEGFFADKVVLVEGEEDRAIILAVAKARNYDFESKNISVIPCYGKPNIPRPLVIFRQLSIPVYPIWDLDLNDKDEKKREQNKPLLRLVGENSQLNDTKITEKFACFKENMRETLSSDIGKEYYDEKEKDIAKRYEIKKDYKKNPIVLQEIIESAYNDNRPSKNLVQIINYIYGS